eukprot:6789926-Pyramimonas_sp.AAC.1
MLGTGAVEVIPPSKAEVVRKQLPDRIISSRMVRRWKPVEGTFQDPEAKSRWCVHGHRDPDSGSLLVYAPTPQTSSIMMFLQVIMNLGLRADIADVKNAFCQSDPMVRSQGQIYVEPCEGIDLPAGSLILLRVNVC